VLSATRLAGCATAEGTARYRARFPKAAEGHFRDARGLTLSSIGIGTYLPTSDDAGYAAAIAESVRRGINVLDTAINYREQQSERAMGRALQALAGEGFDRSELLVCTKAGYLPLDAGDGQVERDPSMPGLRPRDPRRWLELTYLETGIAPPDQVVAGCHCIAPGYLSDQLGRSLTNLGLETIDVHYLHNPEQQLDEVDRATFRGRMRDAFTWAEGERRQGRIRFYGTATWNGYRVPSDHPGRLDLAELVTLAREVGGEGHGFRFVQAPLNLAMPEIASLANQPGQPGGEAPTALLGAARRHGVVVVASASLLQARLARGLPEPLRAKLGLASDAQRALQLTRSAPGLTTALVGMGKIEHVRENAGLVEVPPAARELAAALLGAPAL
jgi:aryl-alcohol dehydrogenase-like predicted oxidoreductase